MVQKELNTTDDEASGSDDLSFLHHPFLPLPLYYGNPFQTTALDLARNYALGSLGNCALKVAFLHRFFEVQTTSEPHVEEKSPLLPRKRARSDKDSHSPVPEKKLKTASQQNGAVNFDSQSGHISLGACFDSRITVNHMYEIAHLAPKSDIASHVSS